MLGEGSAAILDDAQQAFAHLTLVLMVDLTFEYSFIFSGFINE
jgi:hypothetical protein